MFKKLSFLVTLLSVIAYLTGAVFKILHLPGASNLLTGGVIGFLIGIPFMIYFLWPLFNKYLLISCCASLVLICLSAVFKVLHLAGAPVLLLVGLGVFGLIFLPQVFYLIYQKTEYPAGSE